ncbi:DUF5683 domain-containing protein [Aquimarina litoralis]|uniref:DUF5683 domain-containing protein n=1 Tax=Aquimarina litoralis TaxID=584605 RepID=UPI001C57F8D8|nr:hypothetical protein [Aquimarina litoralis]
MKAKSIYIALLLCFCVHIVFAQEEEEKQNNELKVVTEEVAVKKKRKRNKKLRPYEPLAPARAAFYSAIVPGLGQAYTGKYWKIPIVYGALGAGIYFYLDNNRTYNDLRDAYKGRLAGIDPSRLEFPNFTDEQLIDLQRRFRRDQELALLITAGLYVLNIIDANVTAHLQQFNVSKDLTFKPKINFNEFDAKPNYGMSLNYSF